MLIAVWEKGERAPPPNASRSISIPLWLRHKNEEKCGHYKLEIWKRTQLSATAFFESVAVSRFPPCGRSAVTASVVGGEGQPNDPIQSLPPN